MIFTLALLDRKIVDAGEALLHQAVLGELPVLIAIGAKPVAGIVVPFVSEAHGDPVVSERPQLLDEPIVELPSPFARQESDDLVATANKFRAIAPIAVRRVGQRHALRIAAIPAVLGGADLLDRGLARVGRKRGTALGHGQISLWLDRADFQTPAPAER